jgi:hypothetical protein
MHRTDGLRRRFGRYRRRLRAGTRTSITDDGAFPAFCRRAARDESLFAGFRRNPTFTTVLEHVTEEQGSKYLAAIRRDTPGLLDDHLARIMANDAFGDPVLVDYEGIGRISPTTLRYTKVVSDLIGRFGTLDGAEIIEIGGGYGGQARLIAALFDVASYALVDLRECLELARTFLSRFEIGEFEFITADRLRDREWDLVISNYAFSECARPVQDHYRDSVITRSLRGYMTCNLISPNFGVDSYTESELRTMRSDGHVVAEEPLTYEGNFILSWGHDRVEETWPADGAVG